MNIQSYSSKRNAEDMSGYNNSKKPKIELSKEENHFSQLFCEALEIIKKTMQVSDDELKNGIATVIKSFHYGDRNQFSDIDFNMSENLCAYFYRYSQLSTELSRSRILDAVNNCKVLQSYLKRTTINVVSIGGGTSFDIVGMLSAFNEKVNCKKLNVAVVDNAERWKSFLNIVEFLLREGDFGDACHMFKKSNTTLSFLCNDVRMANSKRTPYSKLVMNANLILMKGLLSILSIYDKNEVAKVSDITLICHIIF